MSEPNQGPAPTRTVAPSHSAMTPSASDTVGDHTQFISAASARIGEYVVLGELGHGGMGVVYRAEDPHLKREVALKVMLPQFAANPQAKARFVREARAQAKVEHDHVAAIYQVAEHDGLPYLVMPLLKGMTLHAALRANPRPPLSEVIRIGREVAEGLAAAHEKGLVHRDIKPANIWLEGKKLRVKVLDFGLARTAADSDATDASEGPVTHEGAVVGTPTYMSPEQGRGLPVDGRTDLWSIGVVLYQMTAGELPFRGSTTLAILTALAIDHPPSPIHLNPAVPPSLSDLVMRLLAKHPDHRPPTAELLAEELRAIETGRIGSVRAIPLDSMPPVIVTSAEPDPFAELDSTETNTAPSNHEIEDIPSPRTAANARHFPVWPLVGGVLLAVAGVVAFVISQMGKKPVEPEVAKQEPPPPPQVNPKPRETPVPTVRTERDESALPNGNRILPADGWVSVFPLLDITKDHAGGVGKWVRTDDGYEGSHPMADNCVRLRLPLTVSGNYELEVEATRPKEASNAFMLEVPVGNTTGIGVTLGIHGKAGFTMVNGKDIGDNGTATEFRMGQDQRRRTLVRVVTAGAVSSIQVSVDEKQVLTWTGKTDALSIASGFFTPNTIDVALGPPGKIIIHTVRLRMLTGEAKLTRPEDTMKLNEPKMP